MKPPIVVNIDKQGKVALRVRAWIETLHRLIG